MRTNKKWVNFRVFFTYVLVIGLDISAVPFSDSGTGLITDLGTGLIWQKCSAGQTLPSCTGSAAEYTWSGALSYCNSLSPLEGKTWRLPNKIELMSIIDVSVSNPSIDTSKFSITFTDHSRYWSSSTSIQYTHRAWYVDFYRGYIGNFGGLKNGDRNFVRCVTGP